MVTKGDEACCKLYMFSLMMKCKGWATSLEGKSFYRIKILVQESKLIKKKKTMERKVEFFPQATFMD